MAATVTATPAITAIAVNGLSLTAS